MPDHGVTAPPAGGDEFVIVLTDQPKNVDAISQIVRHLLPPVCEPIRLDGREVTITARIGVCSYPDDGADVDAFLGAADAAMHRVKEIGRDNFPIHTHAKVHGKFLLQEELRNAIARSGRRPLAAIAPHSCAAAPIAGGWHRPAYYGIDMVH